MKIKKISQSLLGLFVVTTFGTTASLLYFQNQANRQTTTKLPKKQLIQKQFSVEEMKYITYQENDKNYFVKDYFQFLILQHLSFFDLKLLKQKIQFNYDNLSKPRSVEVVILNNPIQVWNYSII